MSESWKNYLEILEMGGFEQTTDDCELKQHNLRQEKWACVLQMSRFDGIEDTVSHHPQSLIVYGIHLNRGR